MLLPVGQEKLEGRVYTRQPARALPLPWSSAVWGLASSGFLGSQPLRL